MRLTTDTYNAARQAGAKPIVFITLETDRAIHAYGKDALTEALVRDPQYVYFGSSLLTFGGDPVSFGYGTNEGVFNWQQRVLTFGDFVQAMSSRSEDVEVSLTEKLMDSYTVTLDNADGEFSRLLGREQVIGARLVLLQGFDTPEFTRADCIELFQGTVSRYELTVLRLTLTAEQALAPPDVDDPTVDTTVTYAITTTGIGQTGASETYTYLELEETFFTDVEWVETIQVKIDTCSASTLFEVRDGAFGNTRWKLGIDASCHLQFTYTDDANVATPDYVTITTDYTVPTDTILLPTIHIGTEITICDGRGNCYSEDFPTATGFDLEFGTSGSGDGQFNTPYFGAEDGDGNLWITDRGNDRVQKFSADGTYLDQFGSFGTGNGQFASPAGITIDLTGNILVVDQGNNRVQVFDSTGSYVSQFGTTGTGNGEFDSPIGITSISAGTIFVVDGGNDRVQMFNSGYTYAGQFGSFGTGNGQFNNPTGIHVGTVDGSIYVVDNLNRRVQKFSASGVYQDQVGSFGTGDGQFSFPWGIGEDSEGNILVTDYTLDRIQRFTYFLEYVDQFGSSGTGDGQFDSPTDVMGMSTGNLIVCDSLNSRVQIFAGGVIMPDMTDSGSNNTLIIGEDLDGGVSYVTHNTDVIDLTNSLDDGTLEEWGTNQTYQTAREEYTLITAHEEIIPGTPDIYTNPGNGQRNLTIPLPYGNLIENSDAGVWVCPLIDTVNYVYCVAGWPIQSVADGNVVSVYVDGVLTASGWTFDESNNYESQGAIAILTFTSDQGDAVVSVRCNGKDVDGVLLTDPIDILEDWLDYAVGMVGGVGWEKDPVTFARARAQCALYGYTAAGVIQSSNTIGYWLKNMLASFLGTFRFGSDGELEIYLTELVTEYNIQEYFDEYENFVLNISSHLDNVTNRVLINYANTSQKVDRRYKNGGEISYFRTADESTGTANDSVSKYGERSKIFDFDWTRNTDSVELMQSAILDLYSEPDTTVTYGGQDCKYLPLELRDHISATISLVRDSDGDIEQDVLYELREKAQNLDDFTTTFTAQRVKVIDALA